MTSQRKTAKANATLLDLIPRLDVDAVGVASLAEWSETKLEETARRLLSEARSVVVFAMEIAPETLDLSSHSRITGAPSMNDLLKAEMGYLNGELNDAVYDFARASRSLDLKALPLPAADCPADARFLEAVFSYKHAGQAVGLGKIGWHSLLITPDFGPRLRLAACLTEAELEPTNSQFTIQCESCGICLDSCPAGALTMPQSDQQYAINKFACCTYCGASGGCAECMRVCPVGR